MDEHSVGVIRRETFGLLTESELAVLIDVSPSTLAVWRMEQRGPDYTKLGRSIFYRRVDVEDWIAASVVVTKRTA